MASGSYTPADAVSNSNVAGNFPPSHSVPGLSDFRRKKCIALSLSIFLTLVLLVAVIVFVTRDDRPDPGAENVNCNTTAAGQNQDPKIAETRSENAPDPTGTTTTAKTLVSTATTTASTTAFAVDVNDRNREGQSNAFDDDFFHYEFVDDTELSDDEFFTESTVKSRGDGSNSNLPTEKSADKVENPPKTTKLSAEPLPGGDVEKLQRIVEALSTDGNNERDLTSISIDGEQVNLATLKRSLEAHNVDEDDLVNVAKIYAANETFYAPIGDQNVGKTNMNESLRSFLRRVTTYESDDIDIDGDIDFLEKIASDIETLNDTYAKVGDVDLWNASWIFRFTELWEEFIEKEKSFGYEQIYGDIAATGIRELRPATEIRELQRQFLSGKLAEAAENFANGRDINATTGPNCNAETHFTCDDLSDCYKIEERCNARIQCSDNSDEANCTCLDYVRRDSRKCDGYPDCFYGEDEVGCECPEDSFNCGFLPDSSTPICRKNTLRCDNVIDCPNADTDERNCYALDASLGGIYAYPVQPFRGFLHTNYQGRWRPIGVTELKAGTRKAVGRMAREVCESTVSADNGRADFEPADIGGYIGQMAHLDADSNATADEIDNGRYAFVDAPAFNATKAVFVDCGQPTCGRPTLVRSSPFALLVNKRGDFEDENGKATTRIVGGQVSVPTKWPFVVALYKDGVYACGATIVGPQWIITAAHCVNGFKDNDEHFEVRAGMYRRNADSFTESVRHLSDIFVHEAFFDRNLTNDIALARLDAPLEFNTFAAPACLPDSGESGPHPGERCTAVGWGVTTAQASSAQLGSATLKEVEIPVWSSCPASYNDIAIQVCAGDDEGGKDACQGDSGGPLFCKRTGGSWYLGGVISHGKGCGKPRTPGVYTRVSYYLDWIRQTMSDVSASSDKAANKECKSGVRCGNSLCVNSTRVCDLMVDCYDQADERSCEATREGQRIAYKDGWKFTPRPPINYNNIFPQLPSPDSTAIFPVYPSTTKKVCPQNSFVCSRIPQCIDEQKQCDFSIDCADGSDEFNCQCSEYLARNNPDNVCDDFPNCPDYGDERGCRRDCYRDDFYCELGGQCVRRSQVCDQVADCKFGEDERYCASLVRGDTLFLSRDGRPVESTHGLVTLNRFGEWRAVCTARWTKVVSDRVCRFLGYREAESFSRISTDYNPLLVHVPIEVASVAAGSVYPRTLTSEIGGRYKRQAVGDCTYIETKCSETPDCGRLPLYRNLKTDPPTFGVGVAPWLALFYRNGVHVCDGSLVNRVWIVTHRECAISLSDRTRPGHGDYIVARLGAYKDVLFLSPHEQVRRVEYFTSISGSDIYLAKLAEAAEVTEHVSLICIPLTTWLPVGATCFMHGRHKSYFNHAVETKLVGKCNEDGNKFDLCTEQTTVTHECMDGWSGALVCPDDTGRFLAVGVYHTNRLNCTTGPDGDTTGSIVDTFSSLVDPVSRQAVRNIITTEVVHDVVEGDEACNATAGRHRCPLGKCLWPKQLCDGRPDCADLSDEQGCERDIKLCQHINPLYCACAKHEMMCRNSVCVDVEKFCDGFNDCGDNSDEPEDCADKCAVVLAANDVDKICDGRVDCVDKVDIASDESAERCCEAEDSFRCVLGRLEPGIATQANVTLTDSCVPRSCVCDGGDSDECVKCPSDEDEVDCISVHTEGLRNDLPRIDAFGRTVSESSGYVFFTSHGKSFKYCASPNVFTESRLDAMGEALCQHENFAGLIKIVLHEPYSKTYVGAAEPLDPDEAGDFDSCQLVFLTCATTK